MLIFIFITVFIILLYLAYPYYLLATDGRNFKGEPETDTITEVTLILITYNGKDYLAAKIEFLIKELAQFNNSELIIIDDNSNDGTQEILDAYAGQQHVSIHKKSARKGIVHSMNMGVSLAKYKHIVFCDQRQCLSVKIISRVLDPLRYKNIGAVSGLISSLDKSNSRSLIRMHENFVKLCESRSGNLIGTYGPFYAIKKRCYREIPEDIILDDLYLSLRILSTHKIVLLKDCCIVDENFTSLYDYTRAKRYLTGLFQLIKAKGVIKGLSNKQRLMLFWHKYLRLIIPVLLFISYIFLGVLMTEGVVFIAIFSIASAVLLTAALSLMIRIPNRLRSIAKLNVIYFFAIFDVLLLNPFRRKRVNNIDAANSL